MRRDAWARGKEIRHGSERLYYRGGRAAVFAEGSWVEGRRQGRWTWYFRNGPGRVFAELDFEDGVPEGFCPEGTEYREWGEKPGLASAHLEREHPPGSPHRAHLLDSRRMRLAIGCVEPSDPRFEIRHGPQIDVFRGWPGHFRGNYGQGPAGQGRSHYADGVRHGLQRSWWSTGRLKRESEWHHGKRHGIERDFGMDGHLQLRSEWRRGRRVRATRLEEGRLVWHEESLFRGDHDYTTEMFHADAPWRRLDVRPCRGGEEHVLSVDGLAVEGRRYGPDGRLREIHAYSEGVRTHVTFLIALPGEQMSVSFGAEQWIDQVAFRSRNGEKERRIRFDRGRPLGLEWLAGGEVQAREPAPAPVARASACDAGHVWPP